MQDREFDINYIYKGIKCTAMVTAAEKGEESIFVVDITSPGWEQTIEVYALDPNEKGEIEWTQVNEEAGQIGSDPEMIQLIGTSIVNHQLSKSISK